MQNEHGQAVADHWAKGDVYGLILSALERAGKSLESLSAEDLAPVDHFHARGLPATVDLQIGYRSRQTTTSLISAAALADPPLLRNALSVPRHSHRHHAGLRGGGQEAHGTRQP